MPTRRTVPAAPPLSRRPAGGWAQSCILEEPSGLFPPAPGLHRTCSGEQAHWTSSGEISRWRHPIQGVGSETPGCLEKSLGGLCVLLPGSLPPYWALGGERSHAPGCLVFSVLNVWRAPSCLENRTRMRSQVPCLPHPVPCAEHRGLLRPMLMRVLPRAGARPPNCSEIRASCRAASASP